MSNANQLITFANIHLSEIKNNLKTDEEKAIFAKEFVNSGVLDAYNKLQNEMKTFDNGNDIK